jgi:hypothetical protein
MPIPPCEVSREEFCRAEGIGLKTYLNLQKLGLGPKEFRVPLTNIVRILPEDYAKWRELIKQPDNQAAEHLRRAANSRRYGKLSLKAPGHPANIWARLRREREQAATRRKPSGRVKSKAVAAAE